VAHLTNGEKKHKVRELGKREPLRERALKVKEATSARVYY
jgi:hypothetical protein